MFIEQAVFTSVRGSQFDGYQLAATSGGVSREQAKELVQWGPAHDALRDAPAAKSVNFHQLSDGTFCLSKSSFAGEEYSGRGGQRVYTQTFLVQPQCLARFSNQPFRLLEAAVAAGYLTVQNVLPETLDRVQLVGRASPVNLTRLTRMTAAIAAESWAALLQAVLTGGRVALLTKHSPEQVMAALFDLLPLTRRCEVSFATGLRDAQQRPFRLIVLDGDQAAMRQFLRDDGAVLVDLTANPTQQPEPDDEWASSVLDLLRSNRLADLPQLLQEAAPVHSGRRSLIAQWLLSNDATVQETVTT